ncbi:MAG: VCBS repeat-containing protein, partial [Firmicutes bacterium]|nr:VCBS repeat-containing protein [Bacillota bacterium]
MDTCYKLLPDNVESIGYYQDKACYTATAGIRHYTPALAGQSDTTVDGTADGVLTSWPAGAEVWLYRLKNNFPALLMYRHGAGRVIVSNYYSDYAHGHAQLHRDERNLLRDLLSWARDFAEIPEVRPGGKITLNVPVAYAPEPGQEAPAAKVRLILRSPDRKQVQTKDYPLELTPGGTADLSFTFDDSTRALNGYGLGIWWVNYELYDAAGKLVQSEREGARVALSLHLEGAAPSGLALTVNQALTATLEGTELPFTILAKNEGDAPRTIGYRVEAVLSSIASQVTNAREVASGTITVAPHGTAEVGLTLLPFKAMASAISQSWNKNWWRFIITDEEGKTIVTEFRGVSVYKPTARAEYSFRNLTNPGAEVYQPGDRVMLDLKFINNVPVGYPVDWEVSVKAPDGTVVLEEKGTEMLDPVVNPLIVFTMPEKCKPGTYRLTISLKHAGMKLPLVEKCFNLLTQPYPELAVENASVAGDLFTIGIANRGKINSNYTCRISIHRDNTKIGEIVKDGFLAAGLSGRLEVPLTDLNPFYPYTLAITLSSPGGRQNIIGITYHKYDLSLESSTPYPATRTTSWRETIMLTNRGKETVPELRLKIAIQKMSLVHFMAVPALAPGEKAYLPLALTLPTPLAPGVYPVEFIVEDTGGVGRVIRRKSLTVLPPELKAGPSKERYTLGEEIGIMLTNETEAGTEVAYEINLFDLEGKKIEGKAGSLQIEGATTQTIQWPLKAALRSGKYLLAWELRTSPIAYAFSGRKAVEIIGQNASLEVSTDHPVYTLEENVGALARIANGSYPLRGTLELEITKLSFAARPVEWPCLDGSNERTGRVTASGAMDSAPTVLWASEILDAGPAFPPLVGDVDGDGRNEFVYLDGSLLIIAEAASGHRKRSFDLAGIYPDFSRLTALLLADIDGNGVREILLCVDNRFLAAVDGKAELVWSRLFEEDVLSSPFMAAADLNGDGRMELLLDSCVLDARTGEVVREGTELGTVADLDGDGKPEIVTTWAVFDGNFRVLAECAVPLSAGHYPAVADLDGDGMKEIVIWDTETGLYVYDRDYTLLWSYGLAGILEAAIGDLNGDGKKEVVIAKATVTPEASFALICLNHNGALLWQHPVPVDDPGIMEEAFLYGGDFLVEPCSLFLGDFNGDGKVEALAASPWSGLGLYAGENGEEIWRLSYLMLGNPAAADLEGDGKAELVAVDLYNGFYVSFAGLAGRRQDPVLVARPTVEVDCYHADLGD